MKNISQSKFNRLVGAWKTSGVIHSEGQRVQLIGTDSYELILDGNFILHKSDVKIGGEKSETFEIFKLDGSLEHVAM